MKDKLQGIMDRLKNDTSKHADANVISKHTYSIRATLIITILSICLIPLLIATVIFSIFSSRLTFSTFEKSGTLLTETAVNMIDTKIQFYKDTMDSIIEYQTFDTTLDPNLEDLTSTLQSVVFGDSSILNLYYSSTEADFVSALGEELPEDIDPRDLEGYKNCLETPNEFYYISPYQDIITNDLVLHYHHSSNLFDMVKKVH